MNDPAKELFDAGVNRLRRGEMLVALPLFEKSFSLDPSNSVCLSYMALLIGLERGGVRKATALAKEAIAKSPDIPALYLNLAWLYRKAGRNEDALEALRESLRRGATAEAEALLNEINPRMKPLFPSLGRGHFLNKYGGKILKKTGLRRFRMPRQKDDLALFSKGEWVKKIWA